MKKISQNKKIKIQKVAQDIGETWLHLVKQSFFKL
jgi:hypothetical protein